MSDGKQLRIVLAVSGTRVNGVLTYCRELARELTARGHSVFIVTRSDSWLLDAENVIEGANYWVSEFNRTPSELRRFAEFVRTKKVDIVHTHMSRANFFGVLLKLFCRVPVVATAHACTFQLHWRFNDFVIATSEFILARQRKMNGVSKSKSRCIHCFVDVKRFKIGSKDERAMARKSLGISSNDIVGCVIGDVGPRKGQLLLIRALAEICKLEPQFRLLIVGNNFSNKSYVTEVEAEVSRLNLNRHIVWTGIRNDVHNVLHACDLCIVPSREEPLGLVAVEAGLSGIPVVAARVGGLPEIVHDGRSGMLVDCRDPSQLANSVLRTIKNLDSFKADTENSAQALAEKFNPEHLVTNVLNVYDSLNRRDNGFSNSCGDNS